MRAAADELLAWEALMDSLVVRYWLITGLHFDTKTSFLRRDVCEGWFGARALLSSICFAFMEIICPLLFF